MDAFYFGFNFAAGVAAFGIAMSLAGILAFAIVNFIAGIVRGIIELRRK